MISNKLQGYLLTGAALVAMLPSAALADTAKEKELEARLSALEQAFGSLQGELQSTRAENAQLREAVARNESKTIEVAAVAQAAQAAATKPASAPADGFTVGNGATRVKIGGFLKTVATFSRWSDGDAAANSLGRDFYLPQTIPVGGVRESTDNDFSAKQTRLWLNLETQVAGHMLKGYVETDFQTATGTQGSERTTNGYNLALRRAYVQFDKLTVGQDWSTFQYVGALPESTDFVGPTEGTVWASVAEIRPEHAGRVSIGGPIPNTTLLVLERRTDGVAAIRRVGAGTGRLSLFRESRHGSKIPRWP